MMNTDPSNTTASDSTGTTNDALSAAVPFSSLTTPTMNTVPIPMDNRYSSGNLMDSSSGIELPTIPTSSPTILPAPTNNYSTDNHPNLPINNQPILSFPNDSPSSVSSTVPLPLPPSSSSSSWFPSIVAWWSKLGNSLRLRSSSQEIVLNPAGSSIVPITATTIMTTDKNTISNNPSSSSATTIIPSSTTTGTDSNDPSTSIPLLPSSSAFSTAVNTTTNASLDPPFPPTTNPSYSSPSSSSSFFRPLYTRNPTSYQSSSHGEMHTFPSSTSTTFSPAVYDAFSRPSPELTNAFLRRQQQQQVPSQPPQSSSSFRRWRGASSSVTSGQTVGESSNGTYRQPVTTDLSYVSPPTRLPSSSPLSYPSLSRIPVLPSPSEDNFALDNGSQAPFGSTTMNTSSSNRPFPSSTTNYPSVPTNRRTRSFSAFRRNEFPSSSTTSYGGIPPRNGYSLPPSTGTTKGMVPYHGPGSFVSSGSSMPPSSSSSAYRHHHPNRSFYRYGSSRTDRNGQRPLSNQWNTLPGNTPTRRSRFSGTSGTVQPTILRPSTRPTPPPVISDKRTKDKYIPHPKSRMGQIYDKQVIENQYNMDIER